jgi:5-methylcytosine-specific restriction protein B
MARYSERDTSKTYAAAERFKDECLKRDGSLLFDGASVWTPDNLAALHRLFVAAPDEGDRSFIDKFRDQVKPAGQTITRLAAEMLCVYFLFPSNVGGYRKRELVNEVLGWGGDALSSDHVVSAAFERGIGSGGQGYNTRRPFEIGFLIEFAIAWKKASDAERAEALGDPWKFQERVDDVEGAEARQLRHMLLHLVFPDDFERIASGNHKWRVLSAFDGLVQSPPEDSDQHLRAVRRELEKLLPGKQLDFYWPPLEAAWYDASEAGTEYAPLDVIRHKRQVVLYGPPGTGKTYRAKRLAERIILEA